MIKMAFILLLAAAPAFAADDRSVRGRVSDYLTGRPIADATVVVSNAEGGRFTVATDDAGEYRVAGLDVGRYVVSVEAAGYQRAAREDVRTVEREIAVADFVLAGALTEVVVTARAIAPDPLAGVSTARRDREEIRRSPGTAGDVFRGLDILPGVSSTGAFSNFAVRGNGLRDNLILVDDIPFEKVVHFNQTLGEQEDIGGGGRFSIFAPNLIGSAEFQPGGWRASQGGRNGSLLRLQVAEPDTSTAVASAQIDVAGLEVGYEGPSGVHDGTGVLFSARHLDFERLFKAIDNEDIGAPSLTDVILKTVTKVNDAHTFEVLALYTPEDYTRDVENVLASENYEDASLSRTEQDSALLGLTWRWFAGETAQVKNVLFVRDSDKRSSQGEAFPDLAPPNPSGAQVPVRENILQVEEGEREVGWRSDVSWVRGSGDVVSLGARASRVSLDFDTRLDGDWVRYVYDQNDSRPDPTQRYIVLTPARVDSQFEADETQAALYADYAWRRGALTVTPGLRYDYDGFARESLVSPRLSASWQWDSATRLWVGGGTYFQTPRYLELAADPDNRRLENERSRQVSLGAERFLRDDLRLYGEVYYQSLDRLVVASDRTQGAASNSGDGENTGLDVSVWKRMTTDWSAGASYSYLRAKRNDGIGEPDFDAEQHRPHVFAVFGAWEPSDTWAFSAKWKYASGRPDDAYIVYADVLGDPALLRYSKEIVSQNTERFPAFHSLNIRVDYRRRLGPVNLVAFVDVINAYGRENVDSRRFDERRGVDVENGFEVFPNVGLKFEYAWQPGG